MNKSLTLVLVVLYAAVGLTQGLSVRDLEGKWEFVSWQEADDPSSKRQIGLMMDFNADGTVVSHMAQGPSNATFTIEGDTILYVDKRGEQPWKIVSHTPEKSLIVNNQGALMTLERR